MHQVAAKYACPLPVEGFAIDLVPFNEEGLPLEECILTDRLWLFWKHSKFQIADADEQGCSWLELFARFQYLGGKLLLMTPTPLSLAASKSFWASSRRSPGASLDSKVLRQSPNTSSQLVFTKQGLQIMGSSLMFPACS